MRLKLSLIPLNPKTVVPINYNYPLSSALYKILARAAPDYAKWLHVNGYRSPAERFIKLFTFSRLYLPGKPLLRNRTLAAGDDRPWFLHISSPMEFDFVQNFVMGLFEEQKLEIGGPGAVGHFLIESIETLPEPEFSSHMHGKTLSPIVCTTKRETEGRVQKYFYRVTDDDLPQALRQNLLAKYETIYGKPCNSQGLQVQFDMDYFQQRGERRVSKLIIIKEGTREETKIKGFEVPFSMNGSMELMRIAWHCGLGDKNSMGFGMVDLW